MYKRQTYTVGRVFGYLPGWFGPELPWWNTTKWNKEATALIAELDANPSFLCTHETPESKGGRRVRMARYFSGSERLMRGVVKYGSDCEGPPRHVHGGCSAATANQIAIDFASNLVHFPIKHSTSINVDYFMKVPLGSQLGFECKLMEGTHLNEGEIATKVKFFSLKNGNVYVEADVWFVDFQRPTTSRL